MERHEDVLFGFEVVVEGRLGDAQLFGDLPQAGAVVALVEEEVEGRIEDALAGGALRRVGWLGLGLVGLGELGRWRGRRRRLLGAWRWRGRGRAVGGDRRVGRLLGVSAGAGSGLWWGRRWSESFFFGLPNILLDGR